MRVCDAAMLTVAGLKPLLQGPRMPRHAQRKGALRVVFGLWMSESNLWTVFAALDRALTVAALCSLRRAPGDAPAPVADDLAAEQVTEQMKTLLDEKARLAQENARLRLENEGLKVTWEGRVERCLLDRGAGVATHADFQNPYHPHPAGIAGLYTGTPSRTHGGSRALCGRRPCCIRVSRWVTHAHVIL